MCNSFCYNSDTAILDEDYEVITTTITYQPTPNEAQCDDVFRVLADGMPFESDEVITVRIVSASVANESVTISSTQFQTQYTIVNLPGMLMVLQCRMYATRPSVRLLLGTYLREFCRNLLAVSAFTKFSLIDSYMGLYQCLNIHLRGTWEVSPLPLSKMLKFSPPPSSHDISKK